VVDREVEGHRRAANRAVTVREPSWATDPEDGDVRGLITTEEEADAARAERATVKVATQRIDRIVPSACRNRGVSSAGLNDRLPASSDRHEQPVGHRNRDWE
jgi:hypothetical protein